MRRFVTIALSLSLVLGWTASAHLFAQGDTPKDAKPETTKKDDASKPADTKPADTKPADTKPADTKPAEAKPAAPKAPEGPKPIPPEVEAKLEAARKAVAEAIVAAQDAGLVQTTVDPPPILDILLTGRANDIDAVKNRTGVSPEVFGAWYTGYGKLEGVDPAEKTVRIIQPSAGLKSWYDQRAEVLNRHIDAVRKAKGEAAKADEAKKKADMEAEAKKKADEAKKKADMEAEAKKKADEAKKKADMEAEAKKKADEAKKKADEEAKKKADEAKKKADEEAKKKADEEAKKKADEEAKKKDEAKKDDDKKSDDKKSDDKKSDDKKSDDK